MAKSNDMQGREWEELPNSILPSYSRSQRTHRLSQELIEKSGASKRTGHLKRKHRLMPEDEPPILPATVPPVSVDAKPLPEAMIKSSKRSKMLHRILTKEERDLYQETWIGLWRDHVHDWDKSEDQIDAHTICMETVIQFRLLMLQNGTPTQRKKYSDMAYDQSVKRMQIARGNLAAKRSDRMEAKKQSNNVVVNVLNALGTQGDSVLEERRKNVEIAQDEELQYLESSHQQESIDQIVQKHQHLVRQTRGDEPIEPPVDDEG